MSLNRLLSLTYNGVTIGEGSTIGEPDGGWSLLLTPESGVVTMRFIVADQNGGNALANMATVEQAFSVRRGHLTIAVASTPVNDFDPGFTVLTGYEAFPEIRHSDGIQGPHSLEGETYEISIRFRRPADNLGRRDEHPSMQTNQAIRRKVRFNGVWTAVAGSSGARQQFEDPSAFLAHATTVLDAYDNTVTWTESVHDINANDTNTEISYHSEWWENVDGQVNEERTVHVDLHGLRRAIVVGTWISPSGVLTPGGALAAFNDPATGFLPKILAWLAARYPTAIFNPYSIDPRVNVIDGTVDYNAELWECQFPSSVNTGRRFSKIGIDPLPSGRIRGTVSGVYMQSLVAGVTVSSLINYIDVTNGGLAYVGQVQTVIGIAAGRAVTWDAPTVLRYNYNEQIGIVEFEFSFKEILVSQSLGSAKDPDVIDDQWDLTSTTIGPGDSPFITGGGDLSTNGAGGVVKRPVQLECSYRAWIKLGVDPMTKWNNGLQALVIANIAKYLKPLVIPTALLKITPEVNPTDNSIIASIAMESFVSPFLELSIEENKARDEGDIYSPNLSGQDDDYDLEVGPTQGTKVRTTRLLSTQSTAIYAFLGPKINGPYRRLHYSVGQRTIIVGTAPLQTALYAFELQEAFLLVANVTTDSDNRVATLSGTGNNTNSGLEAPLQLGGGGDQGAQSPNAGDSGGGMVPRQLLRDGFSGPGGASATPYSDFGGDGGGVIPPLSLPQRLTDVVNYGS